MKRKDSKRSGLAFDLYWPVSIDFKGFRWILARIKAKKEEEEEVANRHVECEVGCECDGPRSAASVLSNFFLFYIFIVLVFIIGDEINTCLGYPLK